MQACLDRRRMRQVAQLTLRQMPQEVMRTGQTSALQTRWLGRMRKLRWNWMGMRPTARTVVRQSVAIRCAKWLKIQGIAPQTALQYVAMDYARS